MNSDTGTQPEVRALSGNDNSQRPKRGTQYHNFGEPETINPKATSEAVRREFGRRLYRAMVNKGWNQSELARRAAEHTPSGKFGRDSISNYIRGNHTPGPIHLRALCAALGVSEEELLPSYGVPSVDKKHPPTEFRDLGDGNAWLKVNQEVPYDLGLKILTMLQKKG